jgi:putative transposase
MSDSFSFEDLHAGHHSIRLKGHDYAGGGFYFVTICTHEKRCIFGSIDSSVMQLTTVGQLVSECWWAIPEHFPRVRLYGFVLMPNHLHGIIEIGSQMGRSGAAPLRAAQPRVVAGSLGAVVRSFKAAVAKRARQELRWDGKIWQGNYFERALRDGKEHADARRYIEENILNWKLDLENPERRGT